MLDSQRSWARLEGLAGALRVEGASAGVFAVMIANLTGSACQVANNTKDPETCGSSVDDALISRLGTFRFTSRFRQ